MSLELLKEMFNEKPIGIQYEEEIEDKEQIIERLENETHDLSKQIVNFKKKEKNILLHELDKARHFEEGVFDIKERDYMNELQSKENIIKKLNQSLILYIKKLINKKIDFFIKMM